MDPVLRRYLSSLSAAGVRRIPRGRPRVVPRASSGAASPPARLPARPDPPRAAAVREDAQAADDRPGALQGTLDALPALRPAADPAAALEAVAREVARCTRCKLCQGRTLAVPGEGNPRATVVFVGEGPGADEDRSGRPFVGRAGKLLDDIISKGMGLARDDVFICNVVKCRPPGNRVPEPDEVEACAGYLERQVEAIAPKVLCALGATAARRLLGTELPMSRLRGGRWSWRGIPVIPTYHPAYLLRNPAAKRPTWEDIQRVMEIAGIR